MSALALAAIVVLMVLAFAALEKYRDRLQRERDADRMEAIQESAEAIERTKLHIHRVLMEEQGKHVRRMLDLQAEYRDRRDWGQGA